MRSSPSLLLLFVNLIGLSSCGGPAAPTCTIQQDPCTESSQCCAPLICAQHFCQPMVCGSVTAGCASKSDCCGLLDCTANQCTCRANESACFDGSDCCSGACVASLCVVPPCVPMGRGCTYSYDCCDGLGCQQGQCTGSASADSTLHFTVINSCGGDPLPYRYFDENSGAQFPEGGAFYSVGAMSQTANDLACPQGDEMCFGAGSTMTGTYWGVGLDNSDTMPTGGCFTCDDTSVSFTVNCN